MKIIQPLRNLGPWYARQSRTVRDLIVMGAIGFPLYLLAVWYDALDLFLVYTNEPQSDAIDWLVILFVFLGVAAKIYSVRRTIDLQREVVARRKAQAESPSNGAARCLDRAAQPPPLHRGFQRFGRASSARRGLRDVRSRSRQLQADQRRVWPQVGR